MIAFYQQRFANAADFTFFMVGAFKVDEALPLLARYVGGAAVDRQRRRRRSRTSASRFPPRPSRRRSRRGASRESQTVISFFADPPIDPMEQERVSAATDVLEIALRDILREELGQTYTVSVGLSQALPQRGGGHIEVSFGAAPENIETMTARVMQEVQRLQKDGPSADLINRAKETARRNYETALKQNDYWLGRLQTVHLFDQDPALIAAPRRAHRRGHAAELQDAFKKYFPADRRHGRHAGAGAAVNSCAAISGQLSHAHDRDDR